MLAGGQDFTEQKINELKYNLANLTLENINTFERIEDR